MYKRLIIIFSLFMFVFSSMIIKIYAINQGKWLSSVAQNQSSYRLDIAGIRGNIYDCRYKLLTNKTDFNIAAVSPSIESINVLSDIFSKKEMENIIELYKKGKPFKLNLIDKEVSAEGIDIFRIPNRYSEKQIAPHIIGYIDSEGNGVCGIEKSYNQYLSSVGSCISVKYKVDALNRTLDGERRVIEDNLYLRTKGVVLTLDSRIQKIAQTVACNYLNKGAVVITEVPTCKVRAIVSVPEFSPTNISESIDDENSPLINRAFTAYNIGSIYKLVTAATALELGYPEKLTYNCKGYIDVDKTKFHCFNGNSHGEINMRDAIAYSCNTYFVNISKSIPPLNLLDLSYKFGLGKPIKLAPDLYSSKGNLPSEDELQNESNMANVSFGQGSLMCTPIQISGLINSIASGGKYVEPSIVEGLVDENMNFIERNVNEMNNRVISQKTCDILKESMIASAEYGTSKKGKPEGVSVAAKTATAETGIRVGDKEVIQAWYAGFFPADNPKYSIVILAEDAVGGGESCGPTFKDIVNKIYDRLPGLFV